MLLLNYKFIIFKLNLIQINFCIHFIIFLNIHINHSNLYNYFLNYSTHFLTIKYYPQNNLIQFISN
jgi:hypothetical protein